MYVKGQDYLVECDASVFSKFEFQCWRQADFGTLYCHGQNEMSCLHRGHADNIHNFFLHPD